MASSAPKTPDDPGEASGTTAPEAADTCHDYHSKQPRSCSHRSCEQCSARKAKMTDDIKDQLAALLNTDDPPLTDPEVEPAADTPAGPVKSAAARARITTPLKLPAAPAKSATAPVTAAVASTVPLPTVQCSICSNTFDTANHAPKKLPSCSHTFCQQCLVRHAKKKRKKKRRFTCPDCGVEQKMEAYPNGVVDLPTERIRLDMLGDMLCKDCEKKSSKTKACDNCQTQICEDCSEKHVTPRYCEIMAKVRNLRLQFNDQFMDRCTQRLAQYDKLDLRALRKKIIDTNNEIAAAIDKHHTELLDTVTRNERRTRAVKDTIGAKEFVRKAYAMLDAAESDADLEALAKETKRVKESIAMVHAGKTELEPVNIENPELMAKIRAFDTPMLQEEINKQLAAADGAATKDGN